MCFINDTHFKDASVLHTILGGESEMEIRKNDLERVHRTERESNIQSAPLKMEIDSHPEAKDRPTDRDLRLRGRC